MSCSATEQLTQIAELTRKFGQAIQLNFFEIILVIFAKLVNLKIHTQILKWRNLLILDKNGKFTQIISCCLDSREDMNTKMYHFSLFLLESQ
jgi:hypothetical protein